MLYSLPGFCCFKATVGLLSTSALRRTRMHHFHSSPRRTVAAVLSLMSLSAFAGAANATEPNQLNEVERRTGWQRLFDGATTDGWRNYRRDDVGDGWEVVDGALTRVADGAGDLITEQEFDSFELSLEYRIAAGGNSGLMYHVTEQADEPWQTGPEIQILDNAEGQDPQKAGWLYQLYPAKVDATRPAGEWNELRILVTPDRCETYMNGIAYNRYRKGNDDWREKVAQSKFSKFENFGKSAKGHICLQDHGAHVAFRNIKLRKIDPAGEIENPVDGTLKITPRVAFPKIKWTGWKPVSADGKPQSFRPVILTNAGDGSGRIFVGTQPGVIHIVDQGPDTRQSKVFLDVRDKTLYRDSQFERGLLGLAFHPDFSQNGEFFVYYTTAEAEFDSIVARYRVSSSDPDRADPASEEIVFRLRQPFWNHDGGTILFGPDGYLYIGLGDGGSGNDPLSHGQNLGTLFGSILRIDVDRREGELGYAIPSDNPFVDVAGARGEIWAYGLRNVWRMAFDRETNQLWAADVGQALFEEINLIQRGGNYGWSLREGMHPFGAKSTPAGTDLIEPIWEYPHSLGLSITGGLVYRGKQLPELYGCYVYGDFVTGRIWALRYDDAQRRVVANYEIPAPKLPIMSFGEDEQGEIYMTAHDAAGRGVYRFVKTD